MTAGIAAANPAAVVISASEMPGSDGAKSCASGGAEAVEGVDDAPDGAEESDKRGNRRGNGKPGDVTFQSRNFFRGTNLHAALHGSQTAESGGRRGELPLVFLEAAFKNSHQRAGMKLVGDSGNILQALGFAEGAQEASTLNPSPP